MICSQTPYVGDQDRSQSLGSPLLAADLSGLPSALVITAACDPGRLSAADRSRSRARLLADGLLALVPRLGRRAVVRRFSVSPETVAALASDRSIVLAGVSAAAAHDWALPEVNGLPARPELDGYLSELSLVDVSNAMSSSQTMPARSFCRRSPRSAARCCSRAG
jgi:hypothetical protein